MELDDFKKGKGHSVLYTAGNDSDFNKRLDDLIAEFKCYQLRLRKISVIWCGVLITLAVVYLSLMLRMTGLERTGMLMTVSGFILGAIYFYFRYRPLPVSSFSFCTTDFLSVFEKKVKYFDVIDWYIIIPVLLILGTGGGFIFVGRLLHYTDNLVLLLIIWCLFYLFLTIFGFYAGRKNWEKDWGPIIKKIEEMKSYSFDQDNDQEEIIS